MKQHRKLVGHLIFSVLLLLLVSGCSFAPQYSRPAMELPPATENRTTFTVPVQWWLRYQDPLLDTLVREALNNNRDIEAALARVEQAEAMTGVARSDLFPTPSAQQNSSNSWTSGNIQNAPPVGMQKIRNHDISLRAAWEIDLWGKFRNATYSALASMYQLEGQRDAAMLLVAANTVKAYSTLLTYRKQVDISEATVKQRKAALKYTMDNAEVGTIGPVEVARIRGELEQANYNLHIARQNEEMAFNALTVLLGRSPRQIMEQQSLSLPTRNLLRPLEKIPADLPLQLLEQRPDIRAAEFALMAANFNIGVIRAQYFPSISFDASVGMAARNFSDLGYPLAATWMYAGTINLPLNFWSTRFRELMAKAQCRELVAIYEQTVLQSFSDVRNAGVRLTHLAEAGKALTRMEKDLAQAAAITKERFKEGYATYLESLDAERSLFSTRLSLAELRNSQVAAEVDLYMALGGGWKEGGYAPAAKAQAPIAAPAAKAQAPVAAPAQSRP